MKSHLIFLISLIFVLNVVEAKDKVSSMVFVADCTTTEKIQYATILKVPEFIDTEEAREAVLMALGYSSSDANWAEENFKGQWYYEYSDDNALYTGLSIRTHYLQVAIKISENEVITMVCDSRNLRQSNHSIHKKVSLWKQKLDSKIRIELGRISEYDRMQKHQVVDGIQELDHLHELEVISDKEFAEIRGRLEVPSADGEANP